MQQAKIYVGIRGAGDANTNKILREALAGSRLSTELERKYHKGEKVEVWIVTSDFLKMLYAKEKDFRLKFIVYIESNFTFKRFRLLETSVQKRAKHMKFLSKCLRNVDEL
jgi:hypothetical protein